MSTTNWIGTSTVLSDLQLYDFPAKAGVENVTRVMTNAVSEIASLLKRFIFRTLLLSLGLNTDDRTAASTHTPKPQPILWTTEIETGPKVPVPKPRARTHVAADCFSCRATQSSGSKSRNPDLATAVPHGNIAGFGGSARFAASGSKYWPSSR